MGESESFVLCWHQEYGMTSRVSASIGSEVDHWKIY